MDIETEGAAFELPKTALSLVVEEHSDVAGAAPVTMAEKPRPRELSVDETEKLLNTIIEHTRR